MKFKVGDVVKIKDTSDFWKNTIGKVAKIVEIRGEERNDYLLIFFDKRIIETLTHWEDWELEKVSDKESLAWLI